MIEKICFICLLIFIIYFIYNRLSKSDTTRKRPLTEGTCKHAFKNIKTHPTTPPPPPQLRPTPPPEPPRLPRKKVISDDIGFKRNSSSIDEYSSYNILETMYSYNDSSDNDCTDYSNDSSCD